jgi:hypothetical protein
VAASLLIYALTLFRGAGRQRVRPHARIPSLTALACQNQALIRGSTARANIPCTLQI